MSDGVPEPSELIYVGEPSAAPAFAATGLALAIAGIYGHGLVLPNWFWSVLGATFLLASLRHWLRNVPREIARLPREQPTNPNLR
jgi:hypothetical protein